MRVSEAGLRRAARRTRFVVGMEDPCLRPDGFMRDGVCLEKRFEDDLVLDRSCQAGDDWFAPFVDECETMSSHKFDAARYALHGLSQEDCARVMRISGPQQTESPFGARLRDYVQNEISHLNAVLFGKNGAY